MINKKHMHVGRCPIYITMKGEGPVQWGGRPWQRGWATRSSLRTQSQQQGDCAGEALDRRETRSGEGVSGTTENYKKNDGERYHIPCPIFKTLQYIYIRDGSFTRSPTISPFPIFFLLMKMLVDWISGGDALSS